MNHRLYNLINAYKIISLQILISFYTLICIKYTSIRPQFIQMYVRNTITLYIECAVFALYYNALHLGASGALAVNKPTWEGSLRSPNSHLPDTQLLLWVN